MYHVMQHYREQLQEKALLTSFTQVEMPAVIVLANMELNGFGTTSLHNASCVAVNALQMSACVSSTVVLLSEIDFFVKAFSKVFTGLGAMPGIFTIDMKAGC